MSYPKYQTSESDFFRFLLEPWITNAISLVTIYPCTAFISKLMKHRLVQINFGHRVIAHKFQDRPSDDDQGLFLQTLMYQDSEATLPE